MRIDKIDQLEQGDEIRIWLPDDCQPAGGMWCYGNVKTLSKTTFIDDIMQYSEKTLVFCQKDTYDDRDWDDIESFINDGYKIEKL